MPDNAIWALQDDPRDELRQRRTPNLPPPTRLSEPYQRQVSGGGAPDFQQSFMEIFDTIPDGSDITRGQLRAVREQAMKLHEAKLRSWSRSRGREPTQQELDYKASLARMHGARADVLRGELGAGAPEADVAYTRSRTGVNQARVPLLEAQTTKALDQPEQFRLKLGLQRELGEGRLGLGAATEAGRQGRFEATEAGRQGRFEAREQGLQNRFDVRERNMEQRFQDRMDIQKAEVQRRSQSAADARQRAAYGLLLRFMTSLRNGPEYKAAVEENTGMFGGIDWEAVAQWEGQKLKEEEGRLLGEAQSPAYSEFSDPNIYDDEALRAIADPGSPTTEYEKALAIVELTRRGAR